MNDDDDDDITVHIHGIHVIHCFVKYFIFFFCSRPLRTGVPIVEDYNVRLWISFSHGDVV